MNCKRCGAELREYDRFCSRCGAPVSPGQDQILYPGEEIRESAFRGMDREQETLYDEHLFRDSFLDKTEEGHHALLVTLLVLVAIAAAAMAVFAWWYFRKQQEQENGITTVSGELVPGSSGAGGEAGTSGQGNVAGGSADSSGSGNASSGTSGDDAITILSDDVPNNDLTADDPAVSPGSDASDGLVVISPAEASGEDQSADAAASEAEGHAADASENAAQQSSSETAAENDAAADNSAVQTTEAAADNGSSQTTEDAQGTAAALDVAKLDQLMQEGTEASSYAVYVYDLNGNNEYATNDSSVPMYASACMTVPILYTAAQLLDQGAVTLSDQITYVDSIGGRGEPDPYLRDGQSFPLSYYLTTMLRYSDNNCINCLLDYFGIDNVNRTCQAAGFTSVDLQRKIVEHVEDGAENYVSARDLGMMTKELYNGKFQLIGRDFMLENFHIDPTDANYTILGLAPQIAGDAQLLNQNGRGETRYSEAAVMIQGEKAYVISVMLTGEPGFTFEDGVKDVSGYVYEHLM